MKRTLSRAALATATVMLMGVASGAEKKGKYEYVQVNRFDVQEGIDFPADYQLTMTEDLVKNLENSKLLKQVMRQGETLPEGQPVLRIAGTVTKYKKGSQAARYLVGFGAGATVIEAQVKFYDAATNELLLDKKVDGKVWIGVMGGKSEGANNGVAKEIIKTGKGKFF
jgi:Domain of unknown function (DUF4410)